MLSVFPIIKLNLMSQESEKGKGVDLFVERNRLFLVKLSVLEKILTLK